MLPLCRDHTDDAEGEVGPVGYEREEHEEWRCVKDPSLPCRHMIDIVTVVNFDDGAVPLPVPIEDCGGGVIDVFTQGIF